jgi:hypothetical protein
MPVLQQEAHRPSSISAASKVRKKGAGPLTRQPVRGLDAVDGLRQIPDALPDPYHRKQAARCDGKRIGTSVETRPPRVAGAGRASTTVTRSPPWANASARAGPFRPPPAIRISVSKLMAANMAAKCRDCPCAALPLPFPAKQGDGGMAKNWQNMTAAELGREIGAGRITRLIWPSAHLDAIAAPLGRPHLCPPDPGPCTRRGDGRAWPRAARVPARPSGRGACQLEGPVRYGRHRDRSRFGAVEGADAATGMPMLLEVATQSGLVCLGKTHMSELAFSGLGLNPVTATPPCVNDEWRGSGRVFVGGGRLCCLRSWPLRRSGLTRADRFGFLRHGTIWWD